jgi:hypothetical protein
MEQADDPPPGCPFCSGASRQEFKPVAIDRHSAPQPFNPTGGSPAERAHKVAQDIAEKDYHVADMDFHNVRQGETPKVRYKNDPNATKWVQPNSEMIAAGAQVGRQLRQQFGGDGLDVLQGNLRSGKQVDLIEASRRRSAKVW